MKEIFYLKIFTINFVILLIFLVILEIFFGNWFNKTNLNQLNILRNKTIYYDLNGLYPFKEDFITYSRDSYGFRGNYPNPQSIDILSIGSSITDQRYISNGYTFEDIMHAEFKKINKQVYVVNAGIDGQSTFGHIKNFDYWFPYIPNLKVKYFLFYIGIADFNISPNYEFDDLTGENAKSLIKKLKITIKTNSVLYNLYRKFEGVVLAKKFGLSHNIKNYKKFSTNNWTDTPLINNHESIMKSRLNAYEKRLNLLIQKVQDFNASAIFVTQSKRRIYEFIDGELFGSHGDEKMNGVDYYYMSRLLNKSTKKIALENNVMFIDLDSELKFDLKNDFYDHSHQTVSGTEKIGKYLFNKLNYLFKEN